MIIKISNFGPIKEFTFDLNKDLIAIYGTNNIGKSYAIELVYLFLKFFTNNNTNFDILVNSVKNTFGEYSFKNTKVFFEINDKYSIIFYFTDNSVLFDISNKNSFSVSKEKAISDIKEQISNVYFLPASRSGIYNAMSSFGQIFAELSKIRHLLTKKIEIPSLSEPIADYFIQLTEINGRNNNNVDIINLSQKIESEILKGSVIFDKKTKNLRYKPFNTEKEFELSYVSSMVSEISPIVAFLKYILSKEKKQTVLFIEEPEAHLHPENIIKLVEIFVKLTKLNVKVIMTSHSNYVFNKLNNIIISKELSIDKYSAIKLNQTEEGSVSKELLIDKFGADDENFIDVSEKLYEERTNLIEKMNSEIDNDKPN